MSQNTSPKIKVYAGLSISREEVLKLVPNANVVGPIKRANLIQDIDDQVDIVGIIDGDFYESLSVTSAEIMDALRCGVRVYGSSSMGALRAAECSDYGMMGVGKIFEHIKKQNFFRDDFLGQSYILKPGSDQVLSKSYTYIDFYFALQSIEDQFAPSSKDKIVLLDLYSNIYYPERSLDLLIEKVSESKTFESVESIIKAISLIKEKNISQKNIDAHELLAAIKSDLLEIQNKNELLQKKINQQWLKTGADKLWD